MTRGSPAMYLVFRARACDPSLTQRSHAVIIARNDPIPVAGVLLERELEKQQVHQATTTIEQIC